jgi:hypothetical protein
MSSRRCTKTNGIRWCSRSRALWGQPLRGGQTSHLQRCNLQTLCGKMGNGDPQAGRNPGPLSHVDSQDRPRRPGRTKLRLHTRRQRRWGAGGPRRHCLVAVAAGAARDRALCRGWIPSFAGRQLPCRMRALRNDLAPKPRRPARECPRHLGKSEHGKSGA